MVPTVSQPLAIKDDTSRENLIVCVNLMEIGRKHTHVQQHAGASSHSTNKMATQHEERISQNRLHSRLLAEGNFDHGMHKVDFICIEVQRYRAGQVPQEYMLAFFFRLLKFYWKLLQVGRDEFELLQRVRISHGYNRFCNEIVL